MPKSMFAAVIAVCLVILVSCSSEAPPVIPDFAADMSLSGTLRCGELTAEVTLAKENGVWTAVYSSPESLKGLRISESDVCKVSFDGISFEYPADGVPFTTLTDSITDCLDTAAQVEGTAVKQTADGTEISGTADKSGFIICADAAGNITSVSVGAAVFTPYPPGVT